MRILVIGDFHGKFSPKLRKKLKKQKFDIIFSTGDFCGSDRLSEIIFKHYYAKSDKEIKKLPKKVKEQYEKFSKKAVFDGIKLIKKIKGFNKPLYAVHGNWEPIPFEWDIGVEDNPRDKYLRKFHREFKRGFEFVDFKIKNLGNFVLVGGSPTSYPGKIDKKSIKRFFKKYSEKDPKEAKKIVRLKKKHYKRRKGKLLIAFKKAKKLKKPIIFLTHNCPYGIKLDVIRAKKAHEKARGEHYGSYLERVMIKRFKPKLVICGHMHENTGKDKIGKSLIINFGAAFDNKAGIIEIKDKAKINVKFIK